MSIYSHYKVLKREKTCKDSVYHIPFLNIVHWKINKQDQLMFPKESLKLKIDHLISFILLLKHHKIQLFTFKEEKLNKK